jgi:hypothetical protein
MEKTELDFWIEMSILEIETQADFAKLSFENIAKKGATENRLVFSSIHSFLAHCAIISKLLKASSNGITVGKILGVPDTSIIHTRKYRNRLEHYDRELKKWIKKKGVNANIGINNIGDKNAIQIPNMVFISHFDPSSLTFTLIDEEFNLIRLLREVQTIKIKAFRWNTLMRSQKITPPYHNPE